MEEYKKDDRGRSKAKRLTQADPHTKVDSSTWTPPEALEAGVKTGARPLVKRLYKKGGKVVGKHEGKDSVKHAGRMPRKAGGRTNKLTPDSLINRDVRTANEVREGEKHEGAFKKGGRAHKAGGGDFDMGGGGLDMGQADRSLRRSSKPKPKSYSVLNSSGKVVSTHDNHGDAMRQLFKLGDDLDFGGHELKANYKSGGRAHKFGGGMMGDNPVSQQNQMMGKASGMMKKGGKVRHREYGGTDPIGAMIKDNDFPPSKPSQTLNAVSPKTEMAPDKPMKPKDRIPASTNFGAKKGGKIKHPDEKADRQLIKSMIKPAAFKAEGGSAHGKGCSCKMCWGGRTKKYAGGGIFSGDSKSKIPGDVGGRQAREHGGGTDSGPDFSGAYYDLFSGWHNLDKANPDQIAAMRPEDRAKAYAAQGNAPVRTGSTPNTSSSTTYRRPAPAPTGKGGMGSNPTMDPAQRAEAAAQMIGSGRGMSGPTAEDIANYQRPTGAAGTVTSPYDVYSSNQAGPQTGGFNTSEAARMAQARRLLANHPEMNAAPINQKLNPGGYYTAPTGFGALDRTASDFGSYLYNQMRSADQPAGMYNKGGKVGKGKTNVNIIIATGKGGQPQGMMGGQPMPNAPVSPRIPQQQPQMPPMPPQGGMPPMPPQGMPMQRKSGGRTKYPIDTGAGGANARLEKIDAYGLKPSKRK